MYRGKASDSMRVFAAVLTILLATGMMSGCETGGSVKSQQKTSYLTINPIEIAEVFSDSKGNPLEEELPWQFEYDGMSEEEQLKWADADLWFRGNYLRISGLKDEVLQEKINDRIKQLFLDNVDFVPPYRGIKALLGEEPQINRDTGSVSMYMNVQGNFNDILSVALYCSVPYIPKGAPAEEYTSVNWAVPLNIDLHTGEEIPITALFCDDVDGIEYLNDYLRDILSANNGEENTWVVGDEFVLSAPFETFKDTQKYALTSSGILLLFDYDTPEIYSNMCSQSLTVPYSPEMAILEHFLKTEENIYVSDKPREKNLLYSPDRIDREVRKTSVEDGINTDKTLRWPSKLPQPIKEHLKSLYQADLGAEIAAMQSAYRRAQEEQGSNAEATLSYRIGVTQAGDFANVYIDTYASVYGYAGSSFKEYYFNVNSRYEAYDITADQLKPVQLKDLFAGDADAKKAIKAAMLATLRESLSTDEKYERRNVDADLEEKNAQFADILYDRINGVSVQTSFLQLSFDGDSQELSALCKEIYGEGDADGIGIPYTLEYKYFNCDKMTIFR